MAIPNHQDKTLGGGCGRLQDAVGADSGDTEGGHGLGSSGGSRRPSLGEARCHWESKSQSLCPTVRPPKRGGRGAGRSVGGGGSAQRNSPGSGMPGIQVTRCLEINGSSQEPRTASLPRERKRLQAGQPAPGPSPACSQEPARDFFFGKAWPHSAPFQQLLLSGLAMKRPPRAIPTPQPGPPSSPSQRPQPFSVALPDSPWGPPCPGLSPA